MKSKPKVVVVGAGIAGLSAAFRLKQAGCDVTVLERSDEKMVGGRMSTIHIHGFPVDLAATLLTTEYKEMIALIHDAGLTDQVLPASDVIGIVHGNQTDRVHTGSHWQLLTGGFLSSIHKYDLITLLLDFSKLRPKMMPHDMSRMAEHDFESVRQYAMRRGLHPETLEYLLDVLTTSLCLGEPESASAIAPFVFLNVIFGGGGFFTSRDGVGFLTKGLARQLLVEYRAEVTSVEQRGREVVVTWTRPGESERVEMAQACVIAVPPPHLMDIYRQLSPEQREFLSNVEYSCSIHLAFGLDRPTAESAMLLQIPRVEHPNLVGYVMEHNLAPGRVPTGKGLVMAHFRGAWSAKNWNLEDDKIVDYALAATRRLGVLPELERNMVMVHICRTSPGLVIRRPGDYRAVARFASTLSAGSRVQMASGDYLGHSTTNSSVCSGQHTASRIIKQMQTEGVLPLPEKGTP